MGDVIIGFVIVFAVGVWVGTRFGGRVYMRRLTEAEHKTRLNRVGLRND